MPHPYIFDVDLLPYPVLPSANSGTVEPIVSSIQRTEPDATFDLKSARPIGLPDSNIDRQLDTEYGQMGKFSLFYKAQSPLAMTAKAPFKIEGQEYICVAQYVYAKKKQKHVAKKG